MTEKKYVHNNNNGVASVLLKKVELKLSFIPVAFRIFPHVGNAAVFLLHCSFSATCNRFYRLCPIWNLYSAQGFRSTSSKYTRMN